MVLRLLSTAEISLSAINILSLGVCLNASQALVLTSVALFGANLLGQFLFPFSNSTPSISIEGLKCVCMSTPTGQKRRRSTRQRDKG
jgi:hypothetical protein